MHAHLRHPNYIRVLSETYYCRKNNQNNRFAGKAAAASLMRILPTRRRLVVGGHHLQGHPVERKKGNGEGYESVAFTKQATIISPKQGRMM